MLVNFAPCQLAQTSKPYELVRRGLIKIASEEEADLIWHWNFQSPHQGVFRSHKFEWPGIGEQLKDDYCRLLMEKLVK